MGKSWNLVEFMQHWRPTVIHPSKLIKTFSLTKSQSSTNVSPEELVGMFWKMFEPTESRKSFASLPFIKGVTEPLTGVLKKHDVTIVKKSLITLQQQFPATKISILPSLVSKTNVASKFVLSIYLSCYIREMGRASNNNFFSCFIQQASALQYCFY